MTKITELERTVLINIAENEMTELNGGVPTERSEACTWTDSIEYGGPGNGIKGVEGKVLSGVLSSLTQKKLIDHMEDEDGDTTWLTGEGFKVYQTFNRVDRS